MSQSNAHVIRFDNSKKNAKQAACLYRAGAAASRPSHDPKQAWKRTDTKRMQFAGENEQ